MSESDLAGTVQEPRHSGQGSDDAEDIFGARRPLIEAWAESAGSDSDEDPRFGLLGTGMFHIAIP